MITFAQDVMFHMAFVCLLVFDDKEDTINFWKSSTFCVWICNSGSMHFLKDSPVLEGIF